MSSTAVLHEDIPAKSLDKHNLKLPTLLPFVEFNTTMALEILTERDFVGEGCWSKL